MSTNILVATSNVKLYTGITTTDYDYLIETLVPVIQADIVHYCNNSFINSTMYCHTDLITFSSTGSIATNDTSCELTDYWMSGSVLSVSGSIFNDNYFSVSTAASSYINTNESIVTESSATGKDIIITRVEYPRDLPMIASRMIKYNISSQDDNNVASESLGDYSVSYVDIGANSYPSNIVKGLDKYRKVRMM